MLSSATLGGVEYGSLMIVFETLGANKYSEISKSNKRQTSEIFSTWMLL